MKTPINLGLFQSDLDATGYKIFGLPVPSASSDAATKGYVDAHSGGGGGGGGGGGTSTVTINVKDAPYSATGDGVTDDTTAIQSALNALAAANGGVLFFPKGTYLCNGAFNGTTNSVLRIPSNPPPNPIVVIELRGETPGIWIPYDGTPASVSGAIIKSTKTGSGTAPSILAAGVYDSGSGGTALGSFNQVSLYIRNLTFRTYDNPSIGALQLGTAAGACLEDVTVDTGVDPNALAEPTHGTIGVWMPNSNNYGINFCTRVHVCGYDTAFQTGEHFTAPYAVVTRCKTGINFLFGYHPSQANLNIYHAATHVKFSGAHPVDLLLDVERYPAGNWWSSSTGNDVVDSGDVATGVIRYIIVEAFVGNTTDPISVTGATGLRFINLYDSAKYYVGTDARFVPITGGAKLEVRNPGTDTWATGGQWTNP